MKHEPQPMIKTGSDYITRRLGHKRCLHIDIMTCEKCDREYRMPANFRANPVCTGDKIHRPFRD